jgi:hypothetical protein
MPLIAKERALITVASTWNRLKRILVLQTQREQADTSNVTIELAIKMFRAAPEKYFVLPRVHTTYCWDASPGLGGIQALDNVDVLVEGYVLGHIQNIQIVDGIATIGHFAVADQNLERCGIGRVLANCLARILIRHHGICSIVFEENSTRFEEAGYVNFFKSLGAIQLERRPFLDRADRPRFEWDIRKLHRS